MRDFRDAKAMAQTLRASLAAKGLKVSNSESLELIAKALGAADWNTLSAAIKATEAASSEPTPNVEVSGVALPPVQRFSANLEATLHRAVAAAATRKQGYTTVEHLLLALIEDADAAEVMKACQVDVVALRAALVTYVDQELRGLEMRSPGQPEPTAGFHRVVQRAVIHVQSAGRPQVTGANILVAILSERESRAALLLGQQRMDRYDAVNFIANGVRKGGGRAA
jgi:hypothetical protein